MDVDADEVLDSIRTTNIQPWWCQPPQTSLDVLQVTQQDIEQALNNHRRPGHDNANEESVKAPASHVIRTRKKKAPTLYDSDWEPVKDRVIELHIHHNIPLKQVKAIMTSERNFDAEIRQYRLRISQWKLDKKVKKEEMESIVRHKQQRKLRETGKGELRFRVRGQQVEANKVQRWMQRYEVDELELFAPDTSAATPSAVSYSTMSTTSTPRMESVDFRSPIPHANESEFVARSELLSDYGSPTSMELDILPRHAENTTAATTLSIDDLPLERWTMAKYGISFNISMMDIRVSGQDLEPHLHLMAHAYRRRTMMATPDMTSAAFVICSKLLDVNRSSMTCNQGEGHDSITVKLIFAFLRSPMGTCERGWITMFPNMLQKSSRFTPFADIALITVERNRQYPTTDIMSWRDGPLEDIQIRTWEYFPVPSTLQKIDRRSPWVLRSSVRAHIRDEKDVCVVAMADRMAVNGGPWL